MQNFEQLTRALHYMELLVIGIDKKNSCIYIYMKYQILFVAQLYELIII